MKASLHVSFYPKSIGILVPGCFSFFESFLLSLRVEDPLAFVQVFYSIIPSLEYIKKISLFLALLQIQLNNLVLGSSSISLNFITNFIQIFLMGYSMLRNVMQRIFTHYKKASFWLQPLTSSKRKTQFDYRIWVQTKWAETRHGDKGCREMPWKRPCVRV